MRSAEDRQSTELRRHVARWDPCSGQVRGPLVVRVVLVWWRRCLEVVGKGQACDLERVRERSGPQDCSHDLRERRVMGQLVERLETLDLLVALDELAVLLAQRRGDASLRPGDRAGFGPSEFLCGREHRPPELADPFAVENLLEVQVPVLRHPLAQKIGLGQEIVRPDHRQEREPVVHAIASALPLRLLRILPAGAWQDSPMSEDRRVARSWR